MEIKVLPLIFSLYISSTTTFTFAQNPAVNHSVAEQLCSDRGCLVASSNFSRVHVSPIDYGQPRDSVRYSQLKNVELEDGESAWVAGYAKYSDSIYNHWGCYPYDNVNTIAASEKLEDRGFYQCSKFCENKNKGTLDSDTFYFSLNTTSCFCLSKYEDEWKRTACSETNANGLLLYRRRKRYSTSGIYQCALIRQSERSKWVERTSKCLKNNNIVCVLLVNNSHCVVDYSTAWLGGVNVCSSHAGFMAPYVADAFEYITHRETQYWLGAVSAYTEQAGPGDACLAVTRLGDHLVLEPDDCTTINSFICADDIKQNRDNATAKPALHTTTHINEQTTTANVIQTYPTCTLLNNKTKHSRKINTSTSSPAITTTSKVLITSSEASALGTNTRVPIIVACCSVVVFGGGGIAIVVIIYRRKRKSTKDCRKHMLTQPSPNTCITDNSIADDSERDYATVDETNLVPAKSDAATVPPGTLLNLTSSDRTRDTNASPAQQNSNTLTRKNTLEHSEDKPLSRKSLDNRNNDGKDTDASLSDDYNVLSYSQPPPPARKREESEAHVYDHMPAITNGQMSDRKPRNESQREDQNEYDTTESVKVLLHGDYATARSLRKAGSGEYDTSQNMLRSNQRPDDTYSHIPNALEVAKADDALKETN